MTDSLDRPYSEFMSRTSLIRRWLMLAGAPDPHSGFSDELAANVRAWALVWMGAAAEGFWKPFLTETCREFAGSNVRAHRRQIRAQSIFFIDKFFGEVTKDLNERWERSFDLLEALVSSDRTTTPVNIPYDGKTLRPRHIDLVWKLFQLSSDPFPSMVHRQSLETLANDRNEIAHGERMPATVGRLRSKEDVLKTLTRLEETAEKSYVAIKGLFGLPAPEAF